MEIVHLPPGVVPLLNALEISAVDLEAALDLFRQEREAAGRWHSFHSAFSLDDADAQDLENIEFLFRQVDEALEGPALEMLGKLLPPLYQAVHLMDQVNRRREHAHFSPHPALNDLVMAGGAWIQGRGQPRGVTDRLAVAGEYYRNLRHLARSRRGELKPEIYSEFEVGLKHYKEGLAAAEAALKAEDREALHRALAQLAGAGDVLRHLVDWNRREDERFRECHRRFNIPLVAAELELALETGTHLARDQWGRGVRNLQQVVLPRLYGFWAQARACLVLPSEVRAERIEAVEAALERLDVATGSLLDETVTTQAAREEFEHSLTELSAAFTELEQQAVRPDRLLGTRAQHYWQAGTGALAGSVPLVALRELLASQPPEPGWEGVAAGFRAYLASRAPEALCDALVELASLQPRPEQAQVVESWGCAYCGFVNPLGQHPCRRCGASPSGTLGTESWEA